MSRLLTTSLALAAVTAAAGCDPAVWKEPDAESPELLLPAEPAASLDAPPSPAAPSVEVPDPADPSVDDPTVPDLPEEPPPPSR